ncbi:MAG TPA: DUF4197 domain-containing protein [Sphingobacteriaceae bacterium]|nr:DUF4197 domain-containing protein [Sphingobacteriaceae bacterium]
MKMLKFIPVAVLVFLSNSLAANAQVNVGNVLKQAVSGNPSAAEIGSGLKEALEAGVSKGSDRLSITDGFMKNMAVKILFPPEAQKAEKTLRGLGLNKLCDDMILSLNRAAEDAAKEAKPIFVSAIKQMSVKDASNILLSSQQDAATQYFKTTTNEQLRAAFMPVIKASLDKAGATKYWGDVATTYNKVPLVKKLNTDLNDYATEKSISGLFYEIAQEELKIRSNTSARNSPLLQKVFGYADKSKK